MLYFIVDIHGWLSLCNSEVWGPNHTMVSIPWYLLWWNLRVRLFFVPLFRLDHFSSIHEYAWVSYVPFPFARTTSHAFEYHAVKYLRADAWTVRSCLLRCLESLISHLASVESSGLVAPSRLKPCFDPIIALGMWSSAHHSVTVRTSCPTLLWT